MNKDNRKYVFVGNREYVLREMISMGLNIVSVFVTANSFLEKRLVIDTFINYTVVSKKKELLESLANLDYDVLVSNGCKYILPIGEMQKALYLNVHPSYLPDLKGMDPINGACLFKRTTGAACHVIDEGIDTGKIIARVAIPFTEDLETALLFQLSFKAEVMAFKDAFSNDYQIMEEQPDDSNAIYYTIKPEELLVNFEKGSEYIINQSRSFGYLSKGLFFKCNSHVYKFFKASVIKNPFVLELAKEKADREIILSFENSIVIKLQEGLLRFDQVDKKNGNIVEGDKLEVCTLSEMDNYNRLES